MLKNSYSRGNILFLILIAVALFAALTYAVTNSSRSSGDGATKENNSLIASEITNHLLQIRTAIQRLKMGGCDVGQISFERSPFDGSDTDYVNSASPSNFSCHVFHPNGGGAVAANPPEAVLNANGYDFVTNANVEQVGIDATGDIAAILYGFSEPLCRALNEAIGIPLVSGTVPEDSGDFIDGTYPEYFTGDLAAATNSVSGPSNNCTSGDGYFCAKYEGCFKEATGSENYVFYYVLVPN